MEDFRVGNGWDIHRLVLGRPLVLGGVSIPSDKGCEAHSDGDAVIHALIDAILGAAALGDIGTHFPDTDAQYKNIDSMVLLRRTLELVRSLGYRVVNADVTVVLQSPKLSMCKNKMSSCIAEALGVKPDCVSVKAKTAEHILCELGSGDAVMACVVVLLGRCK